MIQLQPKHAMPMQCQCNAMQCQNMQCQSTASGLTSSHSVNATIRTCCRRKQSRQHKQAGGLTSSTSVKATIRMCCRRVTLGVVSMKSTRSCTSQWKILTKDRMMNMLREREESTAQVQAGKRELDMWRSTAQRTRAWSKPIQAIQQPLWRTAKRPCSNCRILPSAKRPCSNCRSFPHQRHAHLRKAAVKSSRKMVIARHVSTTACPTCRAGAKEGAGRHRPA